LDVVRFLFCDAFFVQFCDAFVQFYDALVARLMVHYSHLIVESTVAF
jgi:hypothetical protein